MKAVDIFGRIRVDGGATREARIIEVDPTHLAAFFKEDPEVPHLYTLEKRYAIKGRNLTAELIGGGTLEFQRASCGCQTPQNLRGPRSQFLSRIPQPADA